MGDNPNPVMENQVELTVGQALQLFYKFGLTTIPVVNERSELVGTFEKNDAVSLGTLRSRLDEKLAPHLERMMLPAGPSVEARLKRLLFEKSRSVPVIGRDGRLSHFWHMGQEPVETELPMPYRDLLFALIDSLHRPVAVVFQEPRAGETASPPFLRRLGISRSTLRDWMDKMTWHGGDSDQGISFYRDERDLMVLLVRRPFKFRDQHYGWVVETKEEFEVAADVICAESSAAAYGLRKKVGAQGIRKVVAQFENFLLTTGMAKSSGDIRQMTSLLGLSRQSLRYKMKKHRLASKKRASR